MAEGRIDLYMDDEQATPSLDGFPLEFVPLAGGFGVYRLADPDAPLEALREDELERAEAGFRTLRPSGPAGRPWRDTS